MRTVWLSALALTLGFAAEGLAQQLPPGGLPNQEEIQRRVQQVLDASEMVTIEIEGIVKLTYKQIPTDPQRVAEILGEQLKGEGKQLPPGVDVEQLAKQYGPQITQFLNDALENLGTFEALVPLKVKSKTIPVGKWKMGIAFDGERPIAILLTGTEKEPLPDDNKPIALRLKARGVDLQKQLTMVFKEPHKQKEGKEKFEIMMAFLRIEAKTRDKVEHKE